jgi:hypothetical protein
MNPRVSRAAVLAFALVCLALSALQGQETTSGQPSERFQRSFAQQPAGTLRVENFKGTIHVTGSNTNQVVVNVLKRFEDGSDADRKRWMENTKINFRNDSQRVEVSVVYPDQSWTCWFCWTAHANYVAQVELEIQVPTKTNLDLDGYKPDIKIESLQGDIRIKSFKAPMTIESTSGAIRIDTYKDEIKLRNVAVRGELDIQSFKAEAQIDARSLEGTVSVQNTKGSIVVRVPQDIGMNVDFAGGRRSTFHTDFPLATQVAGRSGQDVRGVVNGGGARLVLRTDRGSVTLGKRAGEL